MPQVCDDTEGYITPRASNTAVGHRALCVFVAYSLIATPRASIGFVDATAIISAMPLKMLHYLPALSICGRGGGFDDAVDIDAQRAALATGAYRTTVARRHRYLRCRQQSDDAHRRQEMVAKRRQIAFSRQPTRRRSHSHARRWHDDGEWRR